MKLFAVITYHPAKWSVHYPMFYYISEDKEKCEEYKQKWIKKVKNLSGVQVIEIETEKELNYLIHQEIW